MDSFLRQSTASQSRAIGPFIDDTDFKTPETGLTIANTDIKLVVNGGSSANKNSGGATHRINGVYGITFDATDTATVGEIEVSIVVAGALPVFHKFVVLEEAVFDALYAASAPGYVANAPVNVAQFGGTNGTFASGRPEVNTTHIAGSAVNTSSAQLGVNIVNAAGTAWGSGAITAGAIASNAITDAKIASGAITSAKFAAGAFDAVWTVGTRTLTSFGTLVANIWDALTSGLTTTNSIGKLLTDNVNATISSRATQTSVDDIPTNTEFNARTLVAADYALETSVQDSIADLATLQATADSIEDKVDDIIDGTSEVTVGTNNDKTGYAIGTGGIDSSSFSAGAITSSALDPTAGEELADEFLDRNIGGGSSGGSRTVTNALRPLRNKVDTSGGTSVDVYEEDDTTLAWQQPLTRANVDPIQTVGP